MVVSPCVPTIVRKNSFGSLKLDFVYYLTLPPLVLEPQGLIWHDPFSDYLDAARAFTIEGLGFRYAEIFEDEILAPATDDQLDERIKQLVGGRIAPFRERFLMNRKDVEGILTLLQSYKDSIRKL